MANPAPTINQINAFNATQGTIIDFNIIGGTELVRSNKIYIYDLSDNSLICTHLYVSTESIHELPANTNGSIVYESGKSSADFVNGKQYYAQIQTFTDIAGTQGGSGLSVSKLFWCLVDPSLTIATIPSTISTTSYNVSATYNANTSVVSNIIQQYQFSLYSATGSLLQSSGVVVGSGEQQGTSTAYDISYNFSGLSVGSSYYVAIDVTTTQGMSINAQSSTFTVSIDTPTLGEATVVNNACDGYISVTSNLSSEYGGSASGEVATFETDSVNNVTKLEVELDPIQDGTPWQGTDVDSEPYQFRAMPQQSNDYNREYDTLVGGTVNWNQLVQNGNFDSLTGWINPSGGYASTSLSNNVATVTALNSAIQEYSYALIKTNQVYPSEHRLLFTFEANPSKTGTIRVDSNTAFSPYVYSWNVPANQWTRCSLIGTGRGTSKNIYIFPLALTDGYTVGDTWKLRNVTCIDLTAFFGNSATADYVYSLEQANAGAGIAWLRKYFPDLFAYNPYNTGTLKSVKPTAHVTRGVNQWDEEWEVGSIDAIVGQNENNPDKSRSKNYIPCTPNTAYFYCCDTIWASFRFYGADKKYLGQSTAQGINRNTAFTTPSGCYYMRFVLQNNVRPNACCINISNADLNGKYFPAEHHTYPISELELRGIPKLVDGELRFDGDTRKADGAVTRKYGIVDLGTLTWYFVEAQNCFYTYGVREYTKQAPNAVCSKYPYVGIYADLVDKSCGYIYGNAICVRDESFNKDTAAFKTAMSGVYLVYELATPTTETADPFTSPQVCNPYGTEEYVTTNIVPVGHQSRYALVCPITGHDEVEAKIVGKNLFDKDAVSNGKWLSTTTGLEETSANYVVSDYIPVKNGEPIHIPWSATARRWFYDSNKTPKTYLNNSSEQVYTPAENGYIRISILVLGSGAVDINTYQVEFGSTATAYEPYKEIKTEESFNVTLTPTVIDETPYLFKQTGDVRGDRESLELVGGTVNWNQLLKPLATNGGWSIEGGVTATFLDGVASISSTIARNGIINAINWRANHKYLLAFDAKTSSDTNVIYGTANGSVTYIQASVSGDNQWHTFSSIKSAVADYTVTYIYGLSANYNIQVRNAVVIDLTAMFGSTIADYIYSLETANAGAGIAWLRKYFPDLFAYSPYNTGTLKSVKPTAHVTRGVNQWDEEWENGVFSVTTGNPATNASFIRSKNTIPAFPNTAYYITHSGVETAVLFFDDNGNYISYVNATSDKLFTSPSNTAFIKFYSKESTYANDICINISDPDLNGKYYPADHHTYPITELELRGVPKLVDGELRFDGDTRKADGTVNRRYGNLVLNGSNSEDWTYNTSAGSTTLFTLTLSDALNLPNNWDTNIRCAGTRFAPTTASALVGDMSVPWKMALISSKRVMFSIPSTEASTVANMRTWLSSHNVELIYEKATPTTETADPFTDPQEVSIYGTEEFVSSNGVPVGNKTTYKTRDIFGGTLDLVSGVLTVDTIGLLFDGTETQWIAYPGYETQMCYLRYCFYNKIPKYILQPDWGKSDYMHCVSNILSGTITAGQLSTSTAANKENLYVSYPNGVTSLTAWKDYLSKHPLQLVYPLATPLTYQLTPHQIETLIGTNNVWSNAGDVSIEFHIPITNLLVKRQDVDDVSGNWLTLYSQPVEQASDMDFTFIDYLNQYGKTYKYALVPLLTQTQSGVEVEVEGGYTVSDEVQSIFDGVYIGDSTGVQRLKAGVAYNNLNTNQQVGVIPTLGNKYPIIVSNSNIQYDTGSVSGLIVPDDFYSNGNLSRLDMSDKREAINDFLTNKKPKILKDWNGNIWLVVFTDNVDVSFDNNYGMGIATFTSGWTEVGDPTNQEDLQKTGLINVGGD